MYAFNRTPFPIQAKIAFSVGESTPLSKGPVEREQGPFAAWWMRVQQLRYSQPKVLPFALVLFGGVALQQSLILNWGPHVFQAAALTTLPLCTL